MNACLVMGLKILKIFKTQLTTMFSSCVRVSWMRLTCESRKNVGNVLVKTSVFCSFSAFEMVPTTLWKLSQIMLFMEFKQFIVRST